MITFTTEQDQYMQLQMTRAYYQGAREGLQTYAYWKDGVQYVGTTGRFLKEALAEVDDTKKQTLNKFSNLQIT